MRSKKPRIAVLGLKGLPAYGGAATVGENIVKQLYDQYDFTVYSISSHTNRKSGIYEGICQQIVLSSIPLAKLNSLLYYIRAAVIIFFKNYDLIHLHHRDAAFIVPFLKLRFPVLVTTHGVTGSAKKWRRFKWFLDWQLDYFIHFSDLITCVSKNEKRMLQSRFGIDANYIPNGINIIHSPRSSLKDKFDFNKDYITFAAGRIIECKGLDVLLQALKRMDNPPRLKIIGNLNHEPVHKKEILELTKGLDVEFLGLITDKSKLFDIIKNSTIFIFPSRQEAMSIMLLEVASLQVPIVCSDIIENQDIFEQDEVLFFENNDSKDLSNKLK